MKAVSPASVYVSMIPPLVEAAREVGYALAVHGSMGRDLDLIAVPWTEEAVSAEALIMRLLSAAGFCGAHLTHRSGSKTPDQGDGDAPGIKPHGRRAWSIRFQNALYIDVSVMPRLAMPPGAQPNNPVRERPETEVGGGSPAGAAPAHGGTP